MIFSWTLYRMTISVTLYLLRGSVPTYPKAEENKTHTHTPRIFWQSLKKVNVSFLFLENVHQVFSPEASIRCEMKARE